MCGEFLDGHALRDQYSECSAEQNPVNQSQFLERLSGSPCSRTDSLKALVCHRIDSHAQNAMMVVFERNETERPQNAVIKVPHGTKHLCHSVHGSGLGLKGALNEIALAERFCQ